MIRTLSADADAEADAPHFMNKQCLDAPLLIDLSEPEWSPYWMGRFNQRPAGGEPPDPNPDPEVLGLENGHGCTQTHHATQTFLSNAIKVDPVPVKPNSPCRLTDDSKQKSECAIQTDKINLAADTPHSIFANNPELKALVQKYLFKIEKENGQGGDLGGPSGDRLRCPPEEHPWAPAAGHVVETHPSALEEPAARWSQIKETPSPTSPLPTQAGAAWGRTCGLVSETREANTSDSKRWPYSQPSGAHRCDLNPVPYQRSVAQDPLTSLTSSEPFHSIKRLLNETPITDRSPQVESTVLQYPESIASSESFQSIKRLLNETPITDRSPQVESTVLQYPESIASSESFQSIKRLLNETPITDRSPQVESTVLQYPESIASSESFQSIESQVNETCITGRPARVQSAAREPFRVDPEESTRGSAPSLCDGVPGVPGVPGGAVRSAHSMGWYLSRAETDSYCIDQDTFFSDDGPAMVNWHDGSDVEETYEERSSGSGGQEDRGYVSPLCLQRLMGRPFLDQYIDEEEDGGLDAAKVLHGQSLRLVYSTMEERLPEATVQLLADLLQPGFYPPQDITAHLLRGLLLGARCPLHLRVQAFDLLMTTQRHHRTDRSTIPWDWELLITTLDNQEDPTKRHFCEVVRMLLEYVLRTMEDDFRAKLSSAALNESIARAFLSCTSQFTKVREVMGWLCAAIIKATADGGGDEGLRERDDHIRMVSAFQGMLRLALEVDGSPVLSASRLSLELFNALLFVVPLRSHRKLLLDSLQSELLKCKLLQHLLEHSCGEETALPMSLPLLLHFLKHSTLSQEPTDGAHRWPKWEELAEMLWMLLRSYNKVNKGDLRRPITETCEHAAATSPTDAVNRLAVCEAVESLLSRARADLGHDLPDHIEESLSYLQDQLLDVCQS
ncbi:unnamed protein product [Arctogadus glacialis]